MISVILPTYNMGKTIGSALESIYKNDFKDFELIIADDGSTDNTSEIVKGYPARYVLLENNNGAAFARNRAAGLARGDILLFVDADMEIKEGLLRYVDEQFRTTDYDVIAGAFSKEPKIKNIFLLFISTLSNYNYSRSSFVFSTHLAGVRKKVFDELSGFDERHKGAVVEDYEFSQRLIAGGYKCKTDMKIEGYHNSDFTFYTLYRRMFRIGLLKAPIIIEYNKNPKIRNQAKRYLINGEYISSFALILLLVPVITASLYLKTRVLFFIWFMLYIFVKSGYLLTVKKMCLQMFPLLLINDIVVLTGCMIGAGKYYYGKVFKKSHN